MAKNRKHTVLTVESTRGPDDEPACLLTWGALQWYASVAEVRETALDLLACATYADMMLIMVQVVKCPPQIVGHFAGDLLERSGKRYLGHPATVLLTPAGSSTRAEAMVLLKRGSIDGYLTAAEARPMALGWLSAAEATESDQLVSEALRALHMDGVIQEQLFGYLRKLRERSP